MVSDPERVIRNQGKASLLTTFRQKGQRVQEKIDTLDDASRSEDENPLSIPEHGTEHAVESFYQLLNQLQLRA